MYHKTVRLLFTKPFLGPLFLSLSHKDALRLQEWKTLQQSSLVAVLLPSLVCIR